MKHVISLIVIMVILFLSSYGYASDNKLQNLIVSEAAVAAKIIDHVPYGVSDSFAPDVFRVYAFTWIKGAKGRTLIKHLWFYGDRLMAEVPLTIRSGNFRTYSRKTIRSKHTGKWRVDITTQDGRLIKTLFFTIE